MQLTPYKALKAADHKEQLEAARAAAREHLAVFVAGAFGILEPGIKLEWNWHLSCICAYLEAVERGDIRRIIFNMPPRALKSAIISIIYPAWVLGRNASEKFIVASHTMEPLAMKLSRDTLRLMQSNWYKSVFPETVLSKESAGEMETTKNGSRVAVSAGKGFTGMGATYFIMDDPNKPDEALSDAIRTTVNDWVDNTVMSRLNDRRTGRIILVQQRLHEEDVTGYLLKKGGYVHVVLPVEAYEDVEYKLGDKIFGMKKGDLLHPTRLPKSILDEIRIDSGEYAYAGQYMQSPVPIGGGMFKPHKWIKYYDQGKLNYKTLNGFILCDPAGVGDVPGARKGKKSDWTSFQVVGTGTDNNYYLLDMVRDKFNPTERINALFELHRKWNGLLVKPPRVGYESYGLQSDLHYIKIKQEDESYRFDLIPLGGKMSKPDRIARLIPDMENGRWYFPKTIPYTDARGIVYDLVAEMIRGEMETFPVSKHDDCIDALSRIYDAEMGVRFPKLARPAMTVHEESLHWVTM